MSRLCGGAAHSMGYSWRHVCGGSSLPSAILDEHKQDFCMQFWEAYAHLEDDSIINIDETGVFYDTPYYMWNALGQPSPIATQEKTFSRLTAVLAVTKSGKKLPILFIIRGESGGLIEQAELASSPEGHYYQVQSNAWMNSRVWYYYLENVIRPEITKPAAIVVDGLKTHVSQVSRDYVECDLSSYLVQFPVGCTSVLQTLDVGIIALFKAILRSLWLAESEVHPTAKAKRVACIKRAILAWSKVSSVVLYRPSIKPCLFQKRDYYRDLTLIYTFSLLSSI